MHSDRVGLGSARPGSLATLPTTGVVVGEDSWWESSRDGRQTTNVGRLCQSRWSVRRSA